MLHAELTLSLSSILKLRDRGKLLSLDLGCGSYTMLQILRSRVPKRRGFNYGQALAANYSKPQGSQR